MHSLRYDSARALVLNTDDRKEYGGRDRWAFFTPASPSEEEELIILTVHKHLVCPSVVCMMGRTVNVCTIFVGLWRLYKTAWVIHCPLIGVGARLFHEFLYLVFAQ